MGLNHVYKVIWNKTKGCYVVVSELAKRVGRNKAKAIVMATAAMAMVVTPAVMNVNQVEATVLIGSTNGTTISDNGSTVNTWGITIGGGITNAGSHTVHVGDATLEEGNRNVIIGTHATAGVDKIAGRHFVNQSVAIGSGATANEGARAFGDQSIAIGANTISEGNSSIAIGNDDVDKAVGKQITYTNPDGEEETNTIGKAYTKLTGKDLHTDGGQYADTRSGEAAIAIGVKAEAGDISLALGTGAKAKKVNTVSIGTGATADLDNSVAIGGGAVADKDSQGTKQTSTTINGITYEWAGGDKTNKGDIVSFGKPGFERQLKNIAAGEISSTSTDAINGSQIHSLVEKITGTPKLSYTTKDGTPVYKLGDKFYKVNEKGQPISAAGKPVVGTNEDGKLVDADNNVIEPIDPAATPLKNALVNPNPAADKTGTTSPTALNNITSNLVNFDAPNVNGKVPVKNALRNLVNDAVSDDTVATVGDLRNMGWIVSADKTTGADGTATDTAYSETVKNANEVKFVGKDGAIVSGATDAATGVRTITVGLDKKAMSGSGDSGSPVAYTKADGTKVYPVKAENGSVTYHTTPNGEGPNDAVVPGTEVITSVNGPDGTTTPAALTNVASNLVGAKKDTNAPTTEQAAPTVGKGANEVNPNNAATVGDVLNAGWNLQENGTAKDFVKPYDKVNFVNGGNTTAVVTTNAEGTVSNVSFNVTGLPVSYTTEDGKPVSKVGDKFYKVNEQGQPISEAGKPAVKTNDAGKLVDEDGAEIEPINPATTPLKNALVNPNPAADKTGTTSPTQLTNVEGNLVGAKTGTDTPTTEQAALTLGTAADQVNVHNVATVGDVLNAGWNLQENGTAKDFVKPYDKVNFVNGGNTTAVVTTNAEGTVSNVSFNVTGLPVSYTTEDGKPVSKVGDKFYKVNEQGQPVSEAGKPAVKTNDAGKLVDEDGTEIEPINPATTPLKNALVNPNPAADKTGTTSPTQLTNVEGNLVGAKTGTDTPTTEQAAPTLGTAADQVNVHNVATVGDVLNAGWNLQENGTAKDFVKPYDKVNFVNGGNTTAVVTTNAEGTVSNVSFNVTGLPVTYTTEDGKPVSKVGDKFYKVNEQGQPVSEAGKPAVKTNDAGKLVDEDGTEIEPINPATTPLKTALVNPNPAADKTGTTSPTALN
ncbi:ESPR-type extended signal peptide-containing protein, partial [Veillonella sp. CHU110]|uniref:ESPR-type extended signal peptide-containing protein n=1 Tax=Veillonella sp. CHU110 TaxID=2490947 RepID=UPI0013DE9EF3